MTAPAGGDDVDAPRARPYTTTAGRTEADEPLDVASLVRTTGRVTPKELPVDHADVLALCSKPIAVGEVAATLRQPVFVVKIVISDLIRNGAVAARPLSFTPPDLETLERLLHGLQRL